MKQSKTGIVTLPKTDKYVAYYRVSTARQGVSGLGLDAQKTCIDAAVASGSVIAEFTDVASGRSKTRTELNKAIAMCKEQRATLIISKLDRLARDVQFIFELRNSGVNFIACDMPDLTTLSLGIYATFAQNERERISLQTKAALQAKKARDGWWGNGSKENLTDEARDKAYAAITTKAQLNENNKRAAAFIRAATRGGKVSLRKIADQLNEGGFKTAMGHKFTAVQVSRLMQRAVADEITKSSK